MDRMDLLDKRVGRICEELKTLAIRQRYETTDWQIKEGYFVRPGDAEKDPAPFVPFDSHRQKWYGPDRHYFFKSTITVPESFENRPLFLHVTTQIDGWDARNPQFLLFVNENVTQGIDINHRDVLLTGSAKAGTVYQIGLQAWTGTEHTEFDLLVDLREIDPEIEGLYYDLYVPLSAFPRLDPEGKPRRDLEKVLNDAVNLLDLRIPWSDAFYDSVKNARAYLAKALYQDLAGQDEVIASCIGHTHIDVAWWWTVAQTREKASRSFATVLKLMEEYPSYRFMSSQPQLYEFVKECYPEMFEKIRERVKEGRWEPEGGMWVEADCNVTSGESLVRQFLYGKRFFQEEFCKDSRILWLPDVFGYSGALPQIMKQCGIEYFMTTKLSWNQFNKFPYDTFRWRGIDGSEILTHLVTTLDVGQDENNYFTTYNGHLHPDAILGGWHRYQQKELSNDILVCYGYGDGGGGPTREMLENSVRMEKGIEGIPRVRQVFAGTFFDELKERVSDNPRLPVWEGELYFEKHRGTYTGQAKNKRANRKSELSIMTLELFCVLTRDQLPCPKDTIDRLWKKILLNQFHDILPGSAIHEVYQVTAKEYQEIQKTISSLISERMHALVAEKDGFTVFNPTGFAASGPVVIGDCSAAALALDDGSVVPIQETQDGGIAFVRDIPAKGWKSFALVKDAPIPVSPFAISEDGHHITTPFYEVDFDESYLFRRIYDRENDREVLQQEGKGNLIRMYEDKPIYYENWDIDNYYEEKYWDVTDVEEARWMETGPVRAVLYLRRKISLSEIEQKICFYADTRRIEFETRIDWHDHQHLLKAGFPLNIHTQEAEFDIQFGSIRRRITRNTTWERAMFETCGQKWADLSEGHYGVSLLNDCKYGHSVKDGCLSLTLLKSGTEPDPTADQEEHFFTYALYPHRGTRIEADTVAQGYYLNQPLLGMQGTPKIPVFGLIRAEEKNAVIETVKPAEDGNGIIVRLYESDNSETRVHLHFSFPASAVYQCSCLEEKVRDLSLEENGEVSFLLHPYEIATLRFL